MRAPTPEQIGQYRRDGFVLIEEFLDDGELDRWRRQTDDAVAERLAATGDREDS
jgi:phytanoyl-CoA hydroxylase